MSGAEESSGELAQSGFSEAVEIGRGGFGVVFRCHEESVGRTVAVKLLHTGLDAENRARFFREGRAMGRLSGHPNVVEVLQVGETVAGRPYIAMPFLRKGSLAAHTERNGPIPWPDAVSMGVRLAGALESAHRLGTLHRDVKPGNVLLSDYREVQLTDFGIARVQGGFETETGLFIGSVAYSPPDVLEGGPPSARSDVYGLAATLFTLIAGYAAFGRMPDEELFAQFLRIRSSPVPDLRSTGAPDDLRAVLERAMAKEAAERPEMAEFGRALQQVQKHAGLPVAEMAVPAASPQDDAADGTTTAPRPARRRVAGPPPPPPHPPSAPPGSGPPSPPPATPRSEPHPATRRSGPPAAPPRPEPPRPAAGPTDPLVVDTPGARRWPRIAAVAVLVLLLVAAATLAVVIGVRAISATTGSGPPSGAPSALVTGPTAPGRA